MNTIIQQIISKANNYGTKHFYMCIRNIVIYKIRMDSLISLDLYLLYLHEQLQWRIKTSMKLWMPRVKSVGHTTGLSISCSICNSNCYMPKYACEHSISAAARFFFKETWNTCDNSSVKHILMKSRQGDINMIMTTL